MRRKMDLFCSGVCVCRREASEPLVSAIVYVRAKREKTNDLSDVLRLEELCLSYIASLVLLHDSVVLGRTRAAR
jgi:hypothetical protein